MIVILVLGYYLKITILQNPYTISIGAIKIKYLKLQNNNKEARKLRIEKLLKN